MRLREGYGRQKQVDGGSRQLDARRSVLHA
jgi:hypothetical protein